MKICPWCSNQFVDNSRAKNKIYCSDEHGHRYKWEKNRIYNLARNKEYEKNNKAKVRAAKRAYRKDKYASDPMFRLSVKIRVRLQRALKSNKTNSTFELLGCTLEQLKKHIEDKFQPGMSWSNYCKRGWHIDHISPLSAFDLNDPEQLRQACHYTNLQPMWAVDNRVKSNKKQTVILVTGAPGAGKTWVADNLTGSMFNIIDSDKVPRKDLVSTCASSASSVLFLTVGVSTFMKKNPQFNYELIVIKENLDVIKERLQKRGGSVTQTTFVRIKRMDVLATKASFIGTSDEVLAHLRSLLA